MTGTEKSRLRAHAWVVPVLALLCALAYGRALQMPLISDDYLQIELGRHYGPLQQWGELAKDPLYRCRATSIVLTHWTEQVFGIGALTLNLTNLGIHFLNTCLVLLLGIWRPIGFRLAVPMAILFACLQRPHEAVIWYAALPELLVFTFTVGAFLCWVKHLETNCWGWYAASLVCFGLGLLSKESAVVFVPLAFLAAWKNRRAWLLLIPAAVVSLAYFLSIRSASAVHLHLNDGTFSLQAPFWATEARSIGRLLWPTGFAALAFLAWRRRGATAVGLGFAWMVVTLLPYSFLMYQGAVPSRHTYFAAVGLALILGAGWLALREWAPSRPALTAAVAVICLGGQIAYIWSYKHAQFLERAQPTERLLKEVRGSRGPISVSCFPYPDVVAELTLRVGTDGSTWLAKEPIDRSDARVINYCN